MMMLYLSIGLKSKNWPHALLMYVKSKEKCREEGVLELSFYKLLLALQPELMKVRKW